MFAGSKGFGKSSSNNQSNNDNSMNDDHDHDDDATSYFTPCYNKIIDNEETMSQFFINYEEWMPLFRSLTNTNDVQAPPASFDSSFDDESLPHLQLTKILFSNVFGTPRGHPKSKPFVDRIMTFYYADQKVCSCMLVI